MDNVYELLAPECLPLCENLIHSFTGKGVFKPEIVSIIRYEQRVKF